jgi:hypothetical protein
VTLWLFSPGSAEEADGGTTRSSSVKAVFYYTDKFCINQLCRNLDKSRASQMIFHRRTTTLNLCMHETRNEHFFQAGYDYYSILYLPAVEHLAADTESV